MPLIDHPDHTGGPAFERDMTFNGRLARLHKGNSSAAIAESKAARLEASKNAKLQMKMMADQAKAMASMEMPAYEAPPPPPTPGISGADDAALQQRRAAKTRFGFASTVKGGARMATRPVVGVPATKPTP
jgi:hypothetical protein